jgi:hypothetical protein
LTNLNRLSQSLKDTKQHLQQQVHNMLTQAQVKLDNYLTQEMHQAISQHVTLLHDTTEKSIHNIEAVSQDTIEELIADKPPVQPAQQTRNTNRDRWKTSNDATKDQFYNRWGTTDTYAPPPRNRDRWGQTHTSPDQHMHLNGNTQNKRTGWPFHAPTLMQPHEPPNNHFHQHQWNQQPQPSTTR